MSLPTLEELMGGSGAPTAKLSNIGDSVHGIIHGTPQVRQQRDLDTGKPLVYEDSGKPRPEVVITLKTDLREGPDDDGKRRLFAKGDMWAAIRRAWQEAGATGIADGGQLWVQHYDDEPPTRKGLQPKHLHRAKYKAPEVSVPDWAQGGGNGANVPTPQPAATAPTQGSFDDEPPF